MSTVYLVRHGENEANITKEFSHRLVDYDLTERGRLQAAQTATHFRDIGIDRIVSSPLKRALQTAQAIASVKGMDFQVIEAFREVNVGDLESRKPDAAAWELYLSITGGWYAGNPHRSFPNGEDLFSLERRFAAGLKETLSGFPDASRVLVVGHGGIFHAGVLSLCSVPNRDAFMTAPNHNCSVSELEVETDGQALSARLLRWADHSHLSGAAADFVNGLPDLSVLR